MTDHFPATRHYAHTDAAYVTLKHTTLSESSFMLSNTVVLKENHTQLVTNEYGDIPADDQGGMGLYLFDTRYLSAYEFRINGQRPVYLSHSTDRNYLATFQFVNPALLLPQGVHVPRQTISIRRTRFVAEDGLYERLGFFNCNQFPVDLDVTLTFDADFRDMFAVRGFSRQRLSGTVSSTFGSETLEFSYRGRDRVQRHLQIHFEVEPEPLSINSVQYKLHLEPHTPVSLPLYVRPYQGRRRQPSAVRFDQSLDSLAFSYDRWNEASTAFETNNEFFDRSLLRQSRLDIRTLIEFDHFDGHTNPVPSAGIPWYAVPFGRDSIITALQTLIYNPAIAEGTLRFLARHQGRESSDETEEEPGKILHELRRGELANLREIPHVPYYGTVDATPLFIVLFTETMAWLDSDELYRDLMPHVREALTWIDCYGDLDSDGYIEYIPRRNGGVRNHGWKDSIESLQYEDGTLVALPAALVEAQGYVYQAKAGLSELLRRRGEAEEAARLRQEADRLREKILRDFWMPDLGFFAQALDAEKRQVRAVTSNAGHLLWSGVVDQDRAGLVVQRLMAPDMFSGWGIRTLSSQSPNYNPMSYHNGSVWPHDNSLITDGMRRYGFDEEAAVTISAMIEAGLRFPSNRLPELFCGFERDRRFNSSPMAYIRSCSPQAWSAAAPFLFLQTLLDVRPENGGRQLSINPVRTSLFQRFRMSNLRCGPRRVAFEVQLAGDEPRIVEIEGDVTVRSRSMAVAD